MTDWLDDPDLRRRQGRFFVRGEVCQEYGYRVLHLIQSACVIRWMERRWDMDGDIWCALNPQFDLIQEGTIIPWYELVIEGEDGDILSFRWEPRDDSFGEPRAQRDVA